MIFGIVIVSLVAFEADPVCGSPLSVHCLVDLLLGSLVEAVVDSGRTE